MTLEEWLETDEGYKYSMFASEEADGSQGIYYDDRLYFYWETECENLTYPEPIRYSTKEEIPMTLEKTRECIEFNKTITQAAEVIQEQAQAEIDRLMNEIIEIDEVQERKVGVCDYYREKYPDIEKTDIEIIEHWDMLEDKYGNNGEVYPV